ncbi:MAG: YncE family protein, partial [Pseudomonadota bacterium]
MRSTSRFSILLAALLTAIPTARAEFAFVLNSKDDDISLIDTKTYQVVRRIPVGKEPHHLIPTPDNKRLIVANAAGNDLVIFDPHTAEVLQRIPRIPDPYHLGFSPNQKWFVITANRLNRVDIYHHDQGQLKLAAKIP